MATKKQNQAYVLGIIHIIVDAVGGTVLNTDQMNNLVKVFITMQDKYFEAGRMDYEKHIVQILEKDFKKNFNHKTHISNDFKKGFLYTLELLKPEKK